MSAAKVHEISTEDKLDQFAKEYGEIKIFRTRHGVCAFRSPNFAEYQRFTDKITADKGSKFGAMRELALGCRLVPERDDLVMIFDKIPGLILQIATSIQELAGTDIEAEVKKG